MTAEEIIGYVEAKGVEAAAREVDAGDYAHLRVEVHAEEGDALLPLESARGTASIMLLAGGTRALKPGISRRLWSECHAQDHGHPLRYRRASQDSRGNGRLSGGQPGRSPGDAAFIAKALGDIARAKGMSQVAEDAGLSRESLYKALSGERNPDFTTILNVIGALGLKVHAEARRG